MSKFADDAVKEFENKFKDVTFGQNEAYPFRPHQPKEQLKTFLRKTIAEAEKRGVEKIIDNLKERYVTHKFQIKSSDSFCEGLKVAIETSEKKQLEADNA